MHVVLTAPPAFVDMHLADALVIILIIVCYYCYLFLSTSAHAEKMQDNSTLASSNIFMPLQARHSRDLVFLPCPIVPVFVLMSRANMD